MKHRLFIASSTENLNTAYALQENLEHDFEVTIWSQGVFKLSKSTMESLMDTLDETDFAAFVFAPDDVTILRDIQHNTIRDNVIFELGLFIGRLGRSHCFVVVPRSSDDFHLPSDLIGITTASYVSDRSDGNLAAALGPASNKIRTAASSLKKVGAEAAKAVPLEQPSQMGRVEDDLDCISLIESWMGKRPSTDNTAAIRYAEVDIALNLKPGMAEKHIEEAARRWDYVVARRGKDTILLRDSGHASAFY